MRYRSLVVLFKCYYVDLSQDFKKLCRFIPTREISRSHVLAFNSVKTIGQICIKGLKFVINLHYFLKFRINLHNNPLI